MISFVPHIIHMTSWQKSQKLKYNNFTGHAQGYYNYIADYVNTGMVIL